MAETFSLNEAMGAAVPALVPAKRTQKASSVSPVEIPEGSLLPSDPTVLNTIVTAAKNHGVPPAVLLAMAHQESTYRPDAVGPKTKYGQAKGMFQYLDSTAKGVGIDPFDYAQAADAAARQLSERLGRGIDWAIAAHHGGDNDRQHGPITAKYRDEILAKAAVIGREIGEDFQLPTIESGPETFSLDEAITNAPAKNLVETPEPVIEATDEDVSALEAARQAYVKNFSPQALATAGITAIKKGWAGLQEAINSDTVEVERTPAQLRRAYDEYVSNSSGKIAVEPFERWAQNPANAKVRVTAESFQDQELAIRHGLQNGTIKPGDVPKQFSHLVPDTAKGFFETLQNPVKLISEDSLPANLVQYLANAPAHERKAFDEARRVLMQENIVANPDKFPQVSVEAAQRAIDERNAKTDPGIADTWRSLKQAATEDPGKFGATLVNALMADPEMLATPIGLGAKPIQAVRAARGITTASRAAQIADKILDAGSLAAAMNVATGAAENLATTGEVNTAEVKLNAALGFAIGGPLGAVFMRGARANAADLAKAKVTGTYEQILRDQAAADIALENIVTGRQGIDPNLRAKIERDLGIKTPAERDVWLKDRAADIKAAFDARKKNNYLAPADDAISDFESYQSFKAEERVRQAAEWQASRESAEAARASAAAEATQDSAARRARFQEEFEAATAARNEAELNGLQDLAAREDKLIEATRKLDNDEFLDALFTKDDPTIRQTLAKINRREANLRIPKYQRGEADAKTLAALGITAAGATAGAAMFPNDPKKGMVAGALLSGLSLYGLSKAHGSKGRLGAPKIVSQQGAIKPKGGNWTAGIEERISPDLDTSDGVFENSLFNSTKRYLSRYAGTTEDPLNNIVLPDGTRWEDAMDAVIEQRSTPNKYGEFEWNVGKLASKEYQSIRSYMDHVGDYLRTLPKSEVAKMDFVRMVKETKRWDEANARKMDKAQVKFFKDAEVLREYDDGFKWIRLNKPGQFANESDLMGHSVRGYEPQEASEVISDMAAEDIWQIIEDNNLEDVYDTLGPLLNNPSALEKLPSKVAKAIQEIIDKDTKPSTDWIPESIGGHSDYGYGGWDAIKNDKARIYSLRGPNGKPVATVELGKAPPGMDHGIDTDPTPRWEVNQVKGPRNEPVKKIYGDKIADILDYAKNDLAAIIEPAEVDLINANFDDPKGRFRNLINGPRGQLGKADPKTLARIGAVGLGVGAGFALSPEDQKLQGSFLGGLAGLLIPGGGSVLSRMRQSGAISPDGDIISLLTRQGKLANKLEASEILARDAAWTAAAKAGDQNAFGKLYNSYAPEITRYIRKQLKDQGAQLGIDPEDLAQEAFLTMHRNMDKYDPAQPFGAWARTIARNEVVDLFRKMNADKRIPAAESSLEATAGNKLRRVDEEIPGARDSYTGGAGSGSDVYELGAGSEIYNTPENQAIRQESEQLLIQAFEKMPEKMRQMMVLSKLENYTAAEIAEILDTPLGTVNVYLARGEKAMVDSIKGDFKVPRGQRGEVDPKMLKALGLAGTGGGIAYLLSDHDKKAPWKDFWKVGIGVVSGLALSKVGGALLQATDHALGAASTRVLNHSPKIHRATVNLFRKNLEDVHGHFQQVEPFIKRLKELPADVQNVVTRAVMTGDGGVISKLLDHLGDATLKDGYKKLRSSLDSLGDQLAGLNRFKKNTTEYFPRVVVDKDGLMAAVRKKWGAEEGSKIEAALTEANAESMRKNGRGLNQVEESAIINQILFTDKRATQPGWTKSRQIEEITPELLQFYATPAESLHTYIRAAVEDINKAKFFGKYARNMKKGNQEFLDTDRSINNLIAEEVKAGTLTDEGAREVASVLKSVFSDKAPARFVQAAKNLSYAGLLGNFWSAGTQLGDVVMQTYLQGIKPTLESLVRQVTGKQFVDMKDFGLLDSLVAEFATQGKTARYVNKVFKYSLFQGVDRFGKNTALNAAIARARSAVQSESGQLKFANKYGPAFGDDVSKLISELKSGKFSDLTKEWAFLELSRSQPVTRFEMSQWWLDSPNVGRSALILKSFMLKQLDIARRDGVNLIKAGKVAEGTLKLAQLGVVLGLAGTASDVVKQFMTSGVDVLMGEEPTSIDVGLADIPINMFKTFGLTEYVKDQVLGVSKAEAAERRAAGEKGAREKKPDPAGAAMDYIAPPPAQIFTDLATADPKMWRYLIPGFGPYVAQKAQQAAREEREREANRKKRGGTL